MSNKSIIRVFSQPTTLSIIDRARYLTEKQQLIGEYLGKNDWYLFDKTPVDLTDSDQIVKMFIKRIKKDILSSTVIKEVNDDYIDTTVSIDGYYASKKFDNDSLFRYDIGVINKFNTVSSLIISNFHYLKDLNEAKGLKKFVLFLVEVFQPYSIQISESVFYRDLMDLESDEYWFGWMTYFSKDIKIPKLPADIEVEELSNGGRLLITTEEIFTAENPEHVKKAKSLVELFRKNNIRC